jgi:hypothetical protein
MYTEEKAGEQKENFYAQLERACHTAGNNDVKIVLGHTNVKTGKGKNVTQLLKNSFYVKHLMKMENH